MAASGMGQDLVVGGTEICLVGAGGPVALWAGRFGRNRNGPIHGGPLLVIAIAKQFCQLTKDWKLPGLNAYRTPANGVVEGRFD